MRYVEIRVNGAVLSFAIRLFYNLDLAPGFVYRTG